jgi:hypothetical protein
MTDPERFLPIFCTSLGPKFTQYYYFGHQGVSIIALYYPCNTEGWSPCQQLEIAMKIIRVCVLISTALMLLPLSALAQETVNASFDNTDGTFTFDEATGVLNLNNTTEFSSASHLTAIQGLAGLGMPNCASSGCLNGTLSFATGTLEAGESYTDLTSNAFGHTATFNGGGNFMIAYPGGKGLMFSGTFSAGATWTNVGKNTWEFTGQIADGMLTIDSKIYLIPQVVTIQLTTQDTAPVNHTNKGMVVFTDRNGTSNGTFTVAPEPGTLALFGSGLIAIGLVTRRKFSGRSES